MNTKPPLFSIIIPTCNRAKQLRQCLDSIKALDYSREKFEVIVVDDGGKQSLTDTCSAFQADIQISLKKKENGGPASARNEGASHAMGTFLIFTDDDCELDSNYLSVLQQLVKSSPECMIGGSTKNCLTDNLYSSTSQLIVDIVYRHYNADATNSRFLASNNMVVPKLLFDEIGRFDLTFFSAAAEDRELCSRWILNRHRIIYDINLVVYHSHHLTMRSFIKQHFSYGRGAFCFRKLQRAKGWGYFSQEMGFHMNIENWLFYPFRTKQNSAWVLALLLLLWQFTNACGFVWHALVDKLKKSAGLSS